MGPPSSSTHVSNTTRMTFGAAVATDIYFPPFWLSSAKHVSPVLSAHNAHTPEACGILDGGSRDHGLNVRAHVCTFVQMWAWLTCFTGPGLHRTRSCLNMRVCQKPGAVSTVEIVTTAHGACPCPYIRTDIGVAQVFRRTRSCPCTSSIQYSYNWTHRRISSVVDVLDTSQTMGTNP